jgi:DNA modification methylase
MKIHTGDVASTLRRMRPNTFHGCLTDPPYGLSFMGKQWDKGVPSAETWAEVLRVLKPGSFLLAFGGTRTYHGLTCAIEDAGFEIRDCLMWLYGSGFPKSHDISKGIDRAAGVVRKSIGQRVSSQPTGNAYAQDAWTKGHRKAHVVDITAPATPAAQTWNGYGTALKPAWEPIIVAMKPCEGTFAQNALTHGVAGLNIDAGRVGTELIESHGGGINRAGRKYGNGRGLPTIAKGSNPHSGRWPANVLLDEDAAERLGQPSRFFYVAKASRKERGEGNTHPTVKPIKLAEYLARLILPPDNGRLLIPFSGSGSEMLGAKRAGWKSITGIELNPEYAEIAEKRLAQAA